MKVLMPFWNLELFDRYQPQIEALADEVETLYLLNTEGDPPGRYHRKIKFLRLKLPETGNKYYNWWLGRKTVSSFIPSDIDIVYSLSGLWMNIYGQEIADFWNIPHVIRMRGNMIEVRKYQKKKSFQGWLINRTQDNSFRSATLVTCIAEKFIPYLKTIGLTHSQIGEVIPNGVESISWGNTKPELFTPGYVGRISKEKGSDFLLELIKSTPYWTWKITGEIQDSDFIPPNNCHYLGKTPFSEMGGFYDGVSVLVLPSYTEGFPNTILEGYANSKPVIGSVDAIPQEVEVFGSRLELDLTEWKSDLSDLEDIYICYPLAFDEIGREAHEYVKGFMWENHGAGIRRQLDKAILLHGSNIYDQE